MATIDEHVPSFLPRGKNEVACPVEKETMLMGNSRNGQPNSVIRALGAVVTGILLVWLTQDIIASARPLSGSGIVPGFLLLHVLWAIGIGLWACPLSSYGLAVLVSTAAWFGAVVYDVTVNMQGWGRTSGALYLASLIWLWLPNVALLFTLTLLRRRLRPVFPTGACAKCGYSLCGINSPRCPECGTLKDWPSQSDGSEYSIMSENSKPSAQQEDLANAAQLRDDLTSLQLRYQRLAGFTGIAVVLSLVAIVSLLWIGRSTFDVILTNRLWLGTSGDSPWGRIQERSDGNGVEFVLRDNASKSEVATGVESNGNAYHVMRDVAGVKRFQSYLDSNLGPSVTFFNSTGAPCMGLQTQADGTPVVAMLDRTGVSRLSAHLDNAGSARIIVGDATGAGRMLVEVSSSGVATMCVFDAAGSCRTEFGVGPEEEGYFILRDDEGVVHVVGDTADGTTSDPK